ncbi:MAG: NAD(P)-binding domain-containing protein, partial [Gemmatimonadaceae bacterium]
MNVAFLGLGAIGQPMAVHLAEGDFDLTVWNRTHETAERFVASHGGTAMNSARDAVASADI